MAAARAAHGPCVLPDNTSAGLLATLNRAHVLAATGSWAAAVAHPPALALVWALGIGWARVYLGVHYHPAMLAGWLSVRPALGFYAPVAGG